MAGNKILLDTNIVLFLLSGDETLESFLNDKDLYVSVITEMEMLSYHGITETERKKILSFFRLCTVVSLTEEIKAKAIDVRKKYRSKLPDSIIAATALSLKAPLMSGDKALKNLNELNLIFYTP
jgi:predicted nucleic acid-binding protein